MKVSVTLTETLTYEITKEVEITSKEYNYYLKNGKLPNRELEWDLSNDIEDEHHTVTDHYITQINKLN